MDFSSGSAGLSGLRSPRQRAVLTASLTPGGAASFVLTQALKASPEVWLGLKKNDFPSFLGFTLEPAHSPTPLIHLKTGFFSPSSWTLRLSLCTVSDLCTFLEGLLRDTRPFQAAPLLQSPGASGYRPIICSHLEPPHPNSGFSSNFSRMKNRTSFS